MMRYFNTIQKRNWFFVFAFLSIFMMVVIFMFSAQQGDKSQATSDSFLKNVLDLIQTIFNGKKIGVWLSNFVMGCIRRLAHGFIYALLGFFVSGALFCLKFLDSAKKRFMGVMAFCLTYAITDEIHQFFVPCRAFEFGDIAVDFIGSVVGMLVFSASFGIIRAVVSKKQNN